MTPHDFAQALNSMNDVQDQNFMEIWDSVEQFRRLALYAVGDDTRRTAVISKGVDILPVVALINQDASYDVLSDIFSMAQGHIGQQAEIVSGIFGRLHDIARVNDWPARKIVKKIDEYVGLPAGQGLVCNQFFLSARGGRNAERTLVTFPALDQQSSLAVAGCFVGPLDDLAGAVRHTHNEGSPHHRHYQQVLTQARQAGQQCSKLPDLRYALAALRA